MKGILQSLTICLILAASAVSQEPPPAPIQVKTISAPQPVFPPEAADPVYGESVRVMMRVDKTGKVIETVAYGPLAPCANLQDPVAAAIKKAAEDAGKATVFEPILKNGKPMEATTSVTFRLRPGETPMTEEQARAMVPEDVLRGKAKHLAKPDFPRFLLDRYSLVAISVWIDEQGLVTHAAAVTGRPALLDPTVKAACASRFTQTKLGGNPVKVRGVITYEFRR